MVGLGLSVPCAKAGAADITSIPTTINSTSILLRITSPFAVAVGGRASPPPLSHGTGPL
jgi:hypothetical protein